MHCAPQGSLLRPPLAIYRIHTHFMKETGFRNMSEALSKPATGEA